MIKHTCHYLLLTFVFLIENGKARESLWLLMDCLYFQQTCYACCRRYTAQPVYHLQFGIHYARGKISWGHDIVIIFSEIVKWTGSCDLLVVGNENKESFFFLGTNYWFFFLVFLLQCSCWKSTNTHMKEHRCRRVMMPWWKWSWRRRHVLSASRFVITRFF